MTTLIALRTVLMPPILGCFIRSSTIRLSLASMRNGGRWGRCCTRLPGFDRSRAPDLMSMATGESDSPLSFRETCSRRSLDPQLFAGHHHAFDIDHGRGSDRRRHQVNGGREPNAGWYGIDLHVLGLTRLAHLLAQPAKGDDRHTEAEPHEASKRARYFLRMTTQVTGQCPQDGLSTHGAHLYIARRYPTPRTVRMCFGAAGSISSLARSWATKLSTVRSVPWCSVPHTESMT